CDHTSTGASPGLVGHALDHADADAGAYQAWRRTPSSVVIARSSTPPSGSGTAGSGKKMSLSSSMSSGVGGPARTRTPLAHRPGVLAIGIAVAFTQEAFLGQDEGPEVDQKDDRQLLAVESPTR